MTKPKQNESNQRHGRGLASVCMALAGAVESATDNSLAELIGQRVGVEPVALPALGVEARSIASALASIEWAAGDLLFSVQGLTDLQLARRVAFKLAGRMQADGRRFTSPLGEDINVREIIASACYALAVWRSTGRGSEGCDGDGWQGQWFTNPVSADGDGWTEAARVKVVLPIHAAARVAWRAAVLAMSDDNLGESIPLHTVGDDWLYAAALPGESRFERLVRWDIERRALGRSALLIRRIESMKAGRRGRRSYDRVGHAARLMLSGDDCDTAAARAGFKSSGRTSATARLHRAMRALGLEFVGDLRDGHAGAARPAQLAATLGDPIGEPATRVLPSGLWRGIIVKATARRDGSLFGSFAGRLFLRRLGVALLPETATPPASGVLQGRRAGWSWSVSRPVRESLPAVDWSWLAGSSAIDASGAACPLRHVSFVSQLQPVTSRLGVIRYDAERVTKSERRRVRQAWQSLRRWQIARGLPERFQPEQGNDGERSARRDWAANIRATKPAAFGVGVAVRPVGHFTGTASTGADGVLRHAVLLASGQIIYCALSGGRVPI